eukprot:CAMPEP_0198154906 /NCGR_PEP_ID=MMETSP1443-20131203/68852_1 /TAXON_ID=186043 /ORGANISM="Entomoneis sp., Strain CCMP2396" /LENGTH=781 /DNA_ID=CAMNT_0043821623 /DNA_START=186 /DNA_END=2528 /DNA_ORIENTATION=-
MRRDQLKTILYISAALFNSFGCADYLFGSSAHKMLTELDPHAMLLGASHRKAKEGVYRYNICNGLSNQLLYHAASISQAVQQGYLQVEIPDYFILQGMQTTDANVLPSENNSVPFGYAFDQEHFLQTLKQDLGIVGQMVKFTSSSAPKCKGMDALHNANPRVVQKIMDAFQPSKQHMQPLIDAILRKTEGHADNGVCLHHRDGQDWHDHCQRWSHIPDGVYRGNCLSVPGQSFLESVQARGLDKPGRWVYYCGDHEIPTELMTEKSNIGGGGLDTFSSLFSFLKPNKKKSSSSSNYTSNNSSFIPPSFIMTSRQNIIDYNDDDHVIRDTLLQQQKILSHEYGLPDLASARDFWALIDFYVCKALPYFVGNSVSTFSAIQIALRDGHRAYWYNSQSIPLQEMWKVFQVPIVYTYTELSATTGKRLLQTSIESVRQYMPHNRIHILYHGTKRLLQTSIESVRQYMPHNRIHILYHGTNDTTFRSWLDTRKVTLHQHNPTWIHAIEEMRLNGDPNASNLFLHSGNYFGTWQRIDIPLFLETEYVLLLDADTIIRKPFTLADFGLNLTYGIAMSSEINFEDTEPSNAGVTLMNIPHLRHTHADFMKFVLRHVKIGKFDHPSPSDQGAYLVFYSESVRFLSQYFNFKPYWAAKDAVYRRSYILHFHGPKPHDYIRFIMGKGCDKAVKFLCMRGIKFSAPLLCQSLSVFAKASMSVDRHAYCSASFQVPSQVMFCQSLFEHLADNPQCSDFYSVIRESLDAVPSYIKLPRALILKRLGLSSFSRFHW